MNMSEHPHLLLDNVCIVLVNTQFPGNIGAVARAMKNMGRTWSIPAVNWTRKHG